MIKTFHEAFIISEEYKKKFREKKKPILKTIEYTDYSLKKFFELAGKEKWYQNTIFILVTDYENTIVNDEFYKERYKDFIPILLFSLDKKYMGKKKRLYNKLRFILLF